VSRAGGDVEPHPVPGPALVTGAGRGIGRAIALRLASAGRDLALCALEADEVDAVAAEVRGVGRRAFAAAVDVAEPDAIATFVAQARAALGDLDALVNNAGTILLPDDVEHAAAARWDATFAVNARAAYLFCGALLPGMVARGRGRVVNVGSTVGLRGLPRRLAYVASKHAVVGLTRALAEEVRTPGVTINAVCPGAVATRLTLGSRPDADRRGWLEPDDVARTVAHLLGPDAGHVHGAIIELDDRSRHA
jgi:NAD(P)-dependent dehydrogenase (short-subunit alcohol dehydrogenase family)